jgi:hypothetical protein
MASTTDWRACRETTAPVVSLPSKRRATETISGDLRQKKSEIMHKKAAEKRIQRFVTAPPPGWMVPLSRKKVQDPSGGTATDHGILSFHETAFQEKTNK